MVPPLVGKSRLSRSHRRPSTAARSRAPSLHRTWQVSALTLVDQNVWNVNDRFRAHHTLQIMSRRGSYERLSPPPLLHESRRTVGGNDAERLSFTQRHNAELCSAKLYCVPQHSFKHWLQFTGRAGDDSQYLAGRGLLLQRVRQ